MKKYEKVKVMEYVLETSHLLLKYLSLEDAQKIFELSQEKGMKKWIPDQVYTDFQEAKQVIEFLKSHYSAKPNPKSAPFVLGVAIRDTGELIGHVGLSPVGNNVEIGYAIAEKHQGKGYGTEVVTSMSAWCLENLEVPYILGIVDSENKGSCKVLEKAGYTLIEEKIRNAFGREGLCRTYKR